MKRIYAAISFLIIAISLCTTEQVIVSKMYESSSEIISQAVTAIKKDDYKQTERLCSDLNKLWQKNYPLMSAMVDHGSLEDASLSISSLEDLAEQKSDSLEDSLIELKNQIKAMKKGQEISFGNIF
ncbi:MAG: DUF4363 family protein [Acetobacter sp.]|nr:DUF4363 family protein [Bacteroides sp.]MCM1340995.1 DUF4363 family protein [Acetobacter sp.]MCM1432449.1 DUF4363 family protein [Clostridiales bacterium]